VVADNDLGDIFIVSFKADVILRVHR